MCENYNLTDGFKLVTYKKKHKVTNRNKAFKNSQNIIEHFNKEVAIRRVNEAKEDILLSDLYSSLLASLRESESALLNPEIKEIICLGLGRVGECMVSRYQLGLLLCLKDLYNVKVSVFDPIFTENEKYLLQELKCNVLTENIEGKYYAEKTTLFFLPHCPKQLSNNLVWANWGLQINNCVVIASSFTYILEHNTKKVIQENAEYILKIFPYTLELAIINTFKYYDIFNDIAVHVFPYNKLCLLSPDFWKYDDEPKYAFDDIEFITNKFKKIYN